MKYLIDTSVWIWSLDSVERLTVQARDILADGTEEIYLSAATTWELSIKMAIGKLKFPAPPAHYVPLFMRRQNLKPLSVTHEHAAKVYDLPLHHRDPFDRLIVAQALVENFTVLTADRRFRQYDVPMIWCSR